MEMKTEPGTPQMDTTVPASSIKTDNEQRVVKTEAKSEPAVPVVKVQPIVKVLYSSCCNDHIDWHFSSSLYCFIFFKQFLLED